MGTGDAELGRWGDGEMAGAPRWRATASRTISRSSCSFIAHHLRHDAEQQKVRLSSRSIRPDPELRTPVSGCSGLRGSSAERHNGTLSSASGGKRNSTRHQPNHKHDYHGCHAVGPVKPAQSATVP